MKNDELAVNRGYSALAEATESVLEQKRSTFTAVLRPVATREQAMAELAHIRQLYPGASHYCWAYILGDAYQPANAAFSDDGEPPGTAGKPILNVLTHRGAGDCLAVVVRVFGGIKLGAGGLVRCYGSSVSQALDGAQWRELVPETRVRIQCDFADEQRIRLLLSDLAVELAGVNYSTRVTLTVSVREDLFLELERQVVALTSGRGSLE